MSDDLQKKLDAALARIAALESGRTSQSQSRPAGIDPRALLNDPIGTLTKAGLPIDHVTRVFVANALGDQAPPELRMLAAMGPQVSATQALSSEITGLRQRLDQYETKEKQQAARQSFSALAADKSKYPLLAAAMARDPKLFDSDLAAHQGDAAELASSIEGRLKALAPALGAPQPASTANAEKPTGQSTQANAGATGQPKSVNGTDNTPPPLPQSKPGPLTQEDAAALKDRILRKYSQPAAE